MEKDFLYRLLPLPGDDGIGKMKEAVISIRIHQSLLRDKRSARDTAHYQERRRTTLRKATLILLVFSVCFFVAYSSFAADSGIKEVRERAYRLCQEGDGAGAMHLAMKSWKEAEALHGQEHPVTAQHIVIAAEVAKCREKFHLAEKLYKKALVIQEKSLGQSHPDVEACLIALADLYLYNGK